MAPDFDVNILTVFVLACFTALATGLGALPFLLSPNPGRSKIGLANALAAGFMLGASLGLLWEGSLSSIPRTALGAALGVIAIAVTRHALGHAPEAHFGSVSGADARRMLLIVGLMTAHSFSEGVAVGVSFGDSETLGLVISFAIAVHNIPEGFAISLVLIPRGVSVGRAAGWSIFSSLPQPLMAVPAFLFVEAFEPFLPIGLGFAAGAMLWMVATELVPEALEVTSVRSVLLVGLGSAAAMLALQLALL